MQAMAFFQSGNVVLYVSLVILATVKTWQRGNHAKAILGKGKAGVLLAAYLVSLLGYGIYAFVSK